MSEGTGQGLPPKAVAPPTKAMKQKATNVRVLYVRVPEPTFNFAKAQAYLSGMAWPDFVVRLLEEARPFPGPASPLNQEQAPAQ